MNIIDLYLRGRLCRVWGWIEGRDVYVGMMSESFCIEWVEPLDEGPKMFYVNASEYQPEDIVLEDLYSHEAREIEAAFWKNEVYDRNQLTFSWRWSVDPCSEYIANIRS